MAGALPADLDLAMQILTELRGPRVAAAFACGGLLALAGALMQPLFRNPLAEPYLLGVSGGAGLRRQAAGAGAGRRARRPAAGARPYAAAARRGDAGGRLRRLDRAGVERGADRAPARHAV